MDFETIETFAKSPETIYSVIGIAGMTLGYISSRLFSSPNRNMKLAEIEHDKYLSGQKTKQLELEIESQKETNQFELDKLTLSEKDSEHKRQLELVERNYQKTLEQRGYDNKEKEKQKQHQLAMAEKLLELKPLFVEYLETTKMNPDISHGLIQQREEYRQELVDEYVSNNDPISDDDCDIETAIHEIDKLVCGKYPLSESQSFKLPSNLEKLIDIVLD